MRVLLVNPPRSSENKILEYTRGGIKPVLYKLIGPPLGLLTIAAAVKDHDLTFLEMKGEYDLNPKASSLEKVVMEQLEKSKPDIVGVTFIASEFYYGIDIFKTAKKFNPDILTVAGGLHATLCPYDFNDKSVDIVCPGQSANIFRKIVRAKEEGRDIKSVGGILINAEDGLKPTCADIEEWFPANRDFLMPDRSFIKRWLSTYKAGPQKLTATYLFTSLGCPHNCTFCSIWPQFNGKFYQRDIESIIVELKTLDDYKIVRFADANTVVNPDFIDKLCNRILEEKIDKHYVMDVRFDTVVNYPFLIEKLARCGLKVVICGFESFRDEELKKYKKNSSAKLIEQAIEILHANGIKIRGNYVIPSDYDEDDFKALGEYASSHRVVYAGYTILTPMPGTQFYREIKDQIIDHDLSKYNFLNCVLKTRLSLEKFYENMGRLWLIKKGNETI